MVKCIKIKVNTTSWRSRNGTICFLIIHIVIGVSSSASVLLRIVSVINQSYQSISHYYNVIIYLPDIVHDLCVKSCAFGT